jgi:hypothetical protein
MNTNGLEPIIMAVIYLGIEVLKYFTSGKKISMNTERIKEILDKIDNK